MKNRRHISRGFGTAFTAAAIAVTALAAGACSAPAQPAFTPADATAIRQRTQEFRTAFNAKDAEKLVAFYPTEAVLMPPNAPTVRGKEGIREFFKELYAQGSTDLEMDTKDVRGQGTMAYESGTYSLNRRPASGSATRDRGKYLRIWRNQNGAWTIESTIWSSDLPEAVPLGN